MPGKEGHPEQGLYCAVAILGALHDVDIHTEELPTTFDLRLGDGQPNDAAISEGSVSDRMVLEPKLIGNITTEQQPSGVAGINDALYLPAS